MLRLLRIRDFALIREVEVEFGPGLNILTGETGSGKSIIVDALGLLAGERSLADQIRSGCETAVVEGAFSVESGGRVDRLLGDAGVPFDDPLLVRREISAAGRARVYVNNNLATLALLRAIGENLADIHGQQDHHSLLDLATHLEWLDRFGRNEDAVSEVRRYHEAMRETAGRLEALETNEQERRRRIDVLQYQLDEIHRTKLRPQEKEELERERRILANRERIYALATEAYGILYESEDSTIGGLKRLQRLLQELEGIDSNWAAQKDSTGDILYKLEDLAFSLRDSTAGTDFSADQLERVEQRLAELERLTRKYGRSVEDVLLFAEGCEKELQELTSFDETSLALAQQFDSELRRYRQAAASLSEKRRQDAARLKRALGREFQSLALEKMKIEVAFCATDSNPAPGRIPPSHSATGVDRVQFLVAPNVGEELKPLARIASGGELSRVMLAIKSVCGSGEPDKTLVFDEVDAGIGGRVAEAVGRRLRDLAKTNQVLCVTHLPQIAGFADQHFCVTKQVVGSRTETFVQLLRERERVEEIARMMGGQTITEITRRHAKELLEETLRPKKPKA
jgi:DNA repair protein RecN (Recombination protein N)